MSNNSSSIFEAAKASTPGASLVRESLLSLNLGSEVSAEDFVERAAEMAEEMVPDSAPAEIRALLQEVMVSASITSALSEQVQGFCRSNKGELRQSSVFSVTRYVAKNEMLLALTGRLLSQVMGAASLQELNVALESVSVCAQEVREEGMKLVSTLMGREPIGMGSASQGQFPTRIVAFYRKFPASPKGEAICDNLGLL